MYPVTRKEVVPGCGASSTSSGGSVGSRAGRLFAWMAAHASWVELVTLAVIVGLWLACYRTLDAWTMYGAW